MKKQERLNSLIKWVLFFIAYYPLFLIIAVKNSHFFTRLHNLNRSILSDSFTLVIIAGIILYLLLLLFISTQNRASRTEIKIENVKDMSHEALSYILTYLIAFMQLNLTSFKDLLCIIILLVIIGVIYTSSNLLHINPIIYLVGYSIYDVEVAITSIDKKVPIILVAKNDCDIKKEAVVNASLVNDGIKKIYFTKN